MRGNRQAILCGAWVTLRMYFDGYYVFSITRASIHSGRWNFRNRKNALSTTETIWSLHSLSPTNTTEHQHRWISILSTFLVMCQVRFFILMPRSVVGTMSCDAPRKKKAREMNAYQRRQFTHPPPPPASIVHIIWCKCTLGWETTRCNFHFENDCVIDGVCRHLNSAHENQ